MGLVKCIKSIVAHWGASCLSGSTYSYRTIENRTYRLITHYDEYYRQIHLIVGSVKQLREGHTKEELPNLIEGYMHYEEVQEKYTVEVSLPFVHVDGEKGVTPVMSEFCSLTREELKSLYGTDKCAMTLPILEDYFEVVT